MRTALAVTAFLALAFAAPGLALAQGGVLPTRVLVEVVDAPDALLPESLIVVPLSVSYCHTAAGAVAPRASHVDVTISDAPAWVAAELSPKTLFMDFTTPPTGGESCSTPQAVSLLLSVRSDAPPDASAPVAATAVAGENAPNAASEGTASFEVRVTAAPPGATAPEAVSHENPLRDTTADAPSAGAAALIVLATGVGLLRGRRRA